MYICMLCDCWQIFFDLTLATNRALSVTLPETLQDASGMLVLSWLITGSTYGLDYGTTNLWLWMHLQDYLKCTLMTSGLLHHLHRSGWLVEIQHAKLPSSNTSRKPCRGFQNPQGRTSPCELLATLLESFRKLPELGPNGKFHKMKFQEHNTWFGLCKRLKIH